MIASAVLKINGGYLDSLGDNNIAIETGDTGDAIIYIGDASSIDVSTSNPFIRGIISNAF